jgi:hypothetical protein
MRIRDFLAVGAVAGLAGLAYGQVNSAGAESRPLLAAPAPDTAPRPMFGLFPPDADGDGVISDRGVERFPQYVRAVADDGTEGYVRHQDFVGPTPTSPDEARRLAGAPNRSIPVYGDDGQKVIGTFTFGRSGGHQVVGVTK